jgi:hypothetical protein
LREEGEEESDVLRDSDLEREREREREHGLGFALSLLAKQSTG